MLLGLRGTKILLKKEKKYRQGRDAETSETMEVLHTHSEIEI